MLPYKKRGLLYGFAWNGKRTGSRTRTSSLSLVHLSPSLHTLAALWFTVFFSLLPNFLCLQNVLLSHHLVSTWSWFAVSPTLSAGFLLASALFLTGFQHKFPFKETQVQLTF